MNEAMKEINDEIKKVKEEWIENYFIQGTAYAKMFTERTNIPCDQLVIFIMPDNGIPQIFVKTVDDYIPQLVTAIENFKIYQQKTWLLSFFII